MPDPQQPTPAPGADDTTGAAGPAFHGQPHAIVDRDGVRFTLLGTAHVSRESVDAVRAAIAEGAYDAVAVELDAARLQAMRDPDALARLDLVKVIREGRVGLFAANLGLATYQRRLAEQLAIDPGAELRLAANDAEARGLPVQLIDRDVGTTFRRISHRLGWWGRSKLFAGVLAGVLFDDEVAADDIERLKEGDMLESTFGEFASGSPALYATLIDERDRYMAARLRETAGDAREVLAVVGAGPLQGLARYLREDREAPDAVRRELDTLPETSDFPWFTLLLALFVVGGFAWGFWQGGLEVGSDLVLGWVLWTGLLGAAGCLLAGGHPLSILAAFVASPLTPLHPALASGTGSALVEAWIRKPTHADFMSLRDDIQSVRGIWRNRVSRVMLNFFLTSLGTAIGVWTGGAKMLGKLFG